MWLTNTLYFIFRFHGSAPGTIKKDSDHPVFRGPEGTGFDINELKKITVDVRRNIPVNVDPIERTIINPEDVVLVRRPGMWRVVRKLQKVKLMMWFLSRRVDVLHLVML